MKNLTLLSLAAAAVLFTACGEETKKAAAEATAKVTDTVKETTNNAVEATKDAAASAADSAKEAAANAANAAAEKAAQAKAVAEEKAAAAAEALKERAAAATEAAKEKAAEAVEATKAAASTAAAAATGAAAEAAPAADNEAGKALFAKCAGCHGPDGKTKALGKSAIIAGEPAEEIEKKLHEYKAGTRNVAGMGMLMKGQVSSLSDEDIKALAAYIASLK
jgi:cytochrome c553